MEYHLKFLSNDDAIGMLHAMAELYRHMPTHPSVNLNRDSMVVNQSLLSQLEALAIRENILYKAIPIQ